MLQESSGKPRTAVPREWWQRISPIFILGLSLVPIIYSGLMIWSFYDPTGNLHHVQAAIVNEDAGANVESPDGNTRHVNIGEEFQKKLLDSTANNNYRWHSVSPAEARAGLADGTYAAVIEVPKGFSKDATSMSASNVLTSAPALLTVLTNDSVNYVGGNFTKSIAAKLQASLNKSVLEEYLDNIYIGFTDMHDGLDKAANGAGELADGSGKLADGTEKSLAGTRKLSDATGQLSNGSYTLVVALGQINTGADRLAGAAGQLSNGTAKLNSGARKLADGTATLNDKSHQLSDGAQKVSAGSRQVAEGTQKLQGEADKLANVAKEHGITEARVIESSARLREAAERQAQIAHRIVDNYTPGTALVEGAAANAQRHAKEVAAASQLTNSLAERTRQRADDAHAVAAAVGAINKDAQQLGEKETARSEAARTAAEKSAQAAREAGTESEKLGALSARCQASGASDEFCAELASRADAAKTLRGSSQAAHESAQASAQASDDSRYLRENIAKTASAAKPRADRIANETEGIAKDAERADRVVSALVEPTQKIADDTAKLAKDWRSLVSDAASLQPARDTLNQRIDEVDARVQEALRMAPQAYEKARQALAGIELLNDGAHRVAAGSEQVADGNRRLAQASVQLDEGAQQLANGTERANSGAHQLAAGARKLADGTGQAEAGAGRLADGAKKLNSGADRLRDGAEKLNSGAHRLDEGAEELANGLDEAKDRVPSYSAREQQHLSNVASEPVDSNFAREHHLNTFGQGLAPLFTSLSLWIGGMAIFLMMPPFSERAIERGLPFWRVTAGGLLPAYALGVAQALVAASIIHYVIGMPIKHLGLFYLIAIATSIVFVGVNHGLSAVFGPVGKFIGLCLVALQVAGAGGTYPIGTAPSFIQAVHPYLPISHTVNAFRGAIGGGWINPQADFTEMAIWFLVALMLSLIGSRVRLRLAASRREGEAEALAVDEADGAADREENDLVEADEAAQDEVEPAGDDAAEPAGKAE
ncbi:YhgE/Pip family protein [Dermabacteraceae bacterium P13264]